MSKVLISLLLAILPLPLLAADVEVSRIATATQAMPQVLNRYQPLVAQFAAGYPQQQDELTATKWVAAQGSKLWQQAVNDVQHGNFDDRPLYWTRLQLQQQLTQTAGFPSAPWQQQVLAAALEKTSRGFSDIHFDADVQFKILLTGFDPFFLDRHIDQSNPSGLVALALDGYRFTVQGKQAQVQTVLIPVRFADFDAGIIESLLTPVYRDNQVNLVVTVSMGRNDFDIERFPGRNRSAKAPDNRNILTGADPSHPQPPKLADKLLQGPEFVEFSLPAAAITAVTGPWKINDNHTVTTLEQGKFAAQSLARLANATSVEGSGGGYLSNEISYRAILLQQQLHSAIATGHIHTPRISGYDAVAEEKIVTQLQAMLQAAAAALATTPAGQPQA